LNRRARGQLCVSGPLQEPGSGEITNFGLYTHYYDICELIIMALSNEKSGLWKPHLSRWVDWSVRVHFYSSTRPMCLICSESVAVVISGNIKRHFETRHTTFNENYLPIKIMLPVAVIYDEKFDIWIFALKWNNTWMNFNKISWIHLKIKILLSKILSICWHGYNWIKWKNLFCRVFLHVRTLVYWAHWVSGPLANLVKDPWSRASIFALTSKSHSPLSESRVLRRLEKLNFSPKNGKKRKG